MELELEPSTATPLTTPTGAATAAASGAPPLSEPVGPVVARTPVDRPGPICPVAPTAAGKEKVTTVIEGDINTVANVLECHVLLHVASSGLERLPEGCSEQVIPASPTQRMQRGLCSQ